MKSTRFSKSIRVLTVDHQPIVRAGLKATLERSQIAVVVGEASRGTEAIHKAVRLDPDVIFIGLREAVRDEAALIQSLRERAPRSKILLLGSDDDGRDVLRLLRAGAHGYSSQTSSTAELVRATKAVYAGEMYLSATVAPALLDAHDSAVDATRDRASRKRLSPRESQVLGLIARGFTNREIAAQLGISARTVETHRERIMRKLDIHTVAGLTRYVIESDVDD